MLFRGYKNLFSHSNLDRKATCKLVEENNVWSETNESEILILHYLFYIKSTMLLIPWLWYHTSLSPLQVGLWTAKHAPPLAVKVSYQCLYRVGNIGFIYIRNKQLALICSKDITYFPLMEYIHLELVLVALFSNELVF